MSRIPYKISILTVLEALIFINFVKKCFFFIRLRQIACLVKNKNLSIPEIFIEIDQVFTVLEQKGL